MTCEICNGNMPRFCPQCREQAFERLKKAEARVAELERELSDEKNRYYAIINTCDSKAIVDWEGEPLCQEVIRAERQRINHYRNRVAEFERAIRFLAIAAYRDGCTSLVAATALDEALAMVGLPRVDGREPGQAASGSGSSSGSTEKGPGRG
jgi:hypothetical protein